MVHIKDRAVPLDAAAAGYLKASLGVASRLSAWPNAPELPRQLRDGFEIHALRVLKRRVLLAVDVRRVRPGLASIRDQVEEIARRAGSPVIYVTRALASFERRSLIEYKVPFLVPGNQLFLPDLGIDLREYFRQVRSAPVMRLSPATQAMVIYCLLQPSWPSEWQLAEAAGVLGYSVMSVSRAMREMTDGGIGELKVDRGLRWFGAASTREEAWEQAKPLMRSPVKRRVWVRHRSRYFGRLRVAGLSALSRRSSLSEPPRLTYALSLGGWKLAMKSGREAFPEPLPNTDEWEIWTYEPALDPESETVDPLSLTLSLRDSSDEDVQRALDELKEWFPW